MHMSSRKQMPGTHLGFTTSVPPRPADTKQVEDENHCLVSFWFEIISFFSESLTWSHRRPDTLRWCSWGMRSLWPEGGSNANRFTKADMRHWGSGNQVATARSTSPAEWGRPSAHLSPLLTPAFGWTAAWCWPLPEKARNLLNRSTGPYVLSRNHAFCSVKPPLFLFFVCVQIPSHPSFSRLGVCFSLETFGHHCRRFPFSCNGSYPGSAQSLFVGNGSLAATPHSQMCPQPPVSVHPNSPVGKKRGKIYSRLKQSKANFAGRCCSFAKVRHWLWKCKVAKEANTCFIQPVLLTY